MPYPLTTSESSPFFPRIRHSYRFETRAFVPRCFSHLILKVRLAVDVNMFVCAYAEIARAAREEKKEEWKMEGGGKKKLMMSNA